MSRSISQIQSSILANIALNPVLSVYNSTSQVSILNNWTNIVSTSQAIAEQQYDLFTNKVESIELTLAPATAPYIQNKVFNFQYNDTNPQIVQFSTQSFASYYAIVNPAYRIITNCSINIIRPGEVAIRVAGGPTTSTPAPISTTQLQASQNYCNLTLPAGISYNCSSTPADRLYSIFTITANGAYSSSITSALLNAYNNYLTTINFGGTIKLIDIMLALRNVAGVLDIVCNTMIARPNSTSFGGGIIMVNNNQVNITNAYGAEYTSSAGFILDEVTPNDFLSNLSVPGRLKFV